MDTRTIRRTSVTLPALNEPGLYLSNVTSLEGGRGRVAEFHYADADLRDLDLADTHLMDGRITGLKAQRTRLEKLRVDSVEFTGLRPVLPAVDRQQDLPRRLPRLQAHGRHASRTSRSTTSSSRTASSTTAPSPASGPPGP